MGSDWGRNLESRDLILGGLRFAEKGEFLEAIDLWEEALSVGSTGSTEAAYLCIALLEDHLRGLHEGDDLPFPDFREKLSEIGFDAHDGPTRPLDELEEDDSDLWEVASPPSEKLEEVDGAWDVLSGEIEPPSNILEEIPAGIAPTPTTTNELELPSPIEQVAVPIGRMRPVKIRDPSNAPEPALHESEEELNPLADPFDVLREPDEALPELPPPKDYTEEPEERPLSFDLDPLAPTRDSGENGENDGDDFEIVIEDSGGFDNAPLKPWEQEDDSGVLDFAENDILPDTGTHDWGQGTPWSTGDGERAEFGPAPARHRLKSTRTSDRVFDELEFPEDPTGQIRDDVLKEALTHHELGDYHSSQSLIEEHLSSFPNDPRLDDIRKENLRQIEMKHLAKIGSLEARPVVAISADQLVWHNLTQGKGFVLSRVDGKLTVADIVEIVHLSRHETLRLLAELASDGIIHFTEKSSS